MLAKKKKGEKIKNAFEMENSIEPKCTWQVMWNVGWKNVSNFAGIWIMASFHFCCCAAAGRRQDKWTVALQQSIMKPFWHIHLGFCIARELIWKLYIQQQRQSAGFECSAQSHSPAIYGTRMNAAILYTYASAIHAHNPKYRLLQTYIEFV